MIKSINFGSSMIVKGSPIDLRRLYLSLTQEREMIPISMNPENEEHTILWTNGIDKKRTYEFAEDFNNRCDDIHVEDSDSFLYEEIKKYFDNPPEYRAKDVVAAIKDGKFDKKNLNIIA